MSQAHTVRQVCSLKSLPFHASCEDWLKGSHFKVAVAIKNMFQVTYYEFRNISNNCMNALISVYLLKYAIFNIAASYCFLVLLVLRYGSCPSTF
jgi:hypothetical protein